MPWMLCSAQGVEHFFGFWPGQTALAKLHSVEGLEGVVDRQQLVFNHGAQQPNGAHDVDLLLDFLPPEAIKSAVVFTGSAEFKTDMPSGVYTLSGLIDHLKSATEEVMSLNRVHFCVGRLETARLAITGQTDVEHVKSLQRKHGRPR